MTEHVRSQALSREPAGIRVSRGTENKHETRREGKHG